MRHPRPPSFLVAVAAGVGALTAASAPSPLYPVYQRLWGFSAVTLTVIFAVYVFALVAALLTVGSLSDVIGRRPVVSAALVLLAVGMLLFATAESTAGLVTARIVQGFAVGAATGTTTAMITETAPTPRSGSVMSSAASPLGIAIGAVLSGALVQYAPNPRQLVFWVLGALFLVLAAVVWTVPESAGGRTASWAVVRRSLVPGAGLPPSVRPVFVALVPSMIATWALAGLALSLGSSVIGDVLGVRDHLTVSLVLGAFFAAGIVGSALQPVLPPAVSRWAGYATLAIGVIVTVPATLLAALPLYIAGSVVAGVGFGATLRVALGTLAEVAPAAERGRTFASMYVVSYAAFSVPAVAAGFAVEVVGLRSTTVGYCVLEAVLVVVAAVTAARARSTTTPASR